MTLTKQYITGYRVVQCAGFYTVEQRITTRMILGLVISREWQPVTSRKRVRIVGGHYHVTPVVRTFPSLIAAKNWIKAEKQRLGQ